MSTPTEILARGFGFHLNTGTSAVPIWTAVEGIKTWSHSPKTNVADTTDNDDDGTPTHRVASRSHEFTLKGMMHEDADDGARAAGQEAVEAWAEGLDLDSVMQFRITSPGGNLKTFDATAEVTQGGGGNDDPTDWECKISVTGAITNTPA